MITARMSSPGSTLPLLFISWLSSDIVSGYEDLRGTPCKNATAYSEVPAERAQWLGAVKLTMECDPGYDLPLNAPQDSALICIPDGSTWKPDYLPDCNDKIVAYAALMTMTGHFSKATCRGLGDMTTNRTTLTFASSRKVSITDMCSRSAIGECVVLWASVSCEDKTAAGGLSPHISLNISLPIAASTAWSKYTADSAELALSILRNLETSASSSHVKTSIRPVCKTGAVGVLRAGTEIVCRGCSLGHFLDAAQKKCLPCSPGYYGDMVFSTSCKLCPGMSSYFGTPQWKSIISRVPNRVHAISNCPILVLHTNGTLEVRIPSALSALSQVEPQDDNQQPHDHNSGCQQATLSIWSKLTIFTFAVAETCVV